jgi:hypothetical protein
MTWGRMMSTSSAIVCLCAQPAMAAGDCTMAHAIYTQAKLAYALNFKPIDPNSGSASSNDFDVVIPGKDFRLTGAVEWSQGTSRPDARISQNCPQSPTDEQWDDCTKWQGLVYGLGDGDVDFIPAEGEPAPKHLLLPDFGRLIHYAVSTDDVAWDVFTLSGCAR